MRAGEQDDEFAPALFHTFYPDTAAKTFYRFFAEGQAEPCAAPFSREVARLDIALKDVGDFFWRNSAAGVTNADTGVPLKVIEPLRSNDIVRDVHTGQFAPAVELY